MPAYLNLVGDNKCMSRVIRGNFTATAIANTSTFHEVHVDGNIGNGAVISGCQRVVLGDGLLDAISASYAYNSDTGKTDILFSLLSSASSDKTVHVNYSIMVSD